MFDPYFTTKRTGSGLGLAIAKNIIEGMGGSIALDSRPGGGTEIRIDLPVRSRGQHVTRGGTLLLVDDEQKIRRTLGQALRAEGHDVLEAGSVREAQRMLAERSVDVLVVDNLMPDATGLDLIRELVAVTAETERPQILMMTAHATIESAIEAMKLGALDYLQKPFEVDELLVVVRRALDHQRLSSHQRYLLNERDEEFNHYGIVGRSRAMEDVIRKAELVAETKSTVLITGETGTGKELVARAIHARSAQRDMPLIKVNCAAIPETLLESELFGHVRGAFTGAATSKKGKFALADGGTILLDEIGTMSPVLQSKLLRVLQEREFEPLGSERSQQVDVRVIAATNRDLRQMVVGRHLSGRSVSTGSTSSPSRCRRSGTGAKTSPFSPNTSCASINSAQASASIASRTASTRNLRPTNGRATSASSRIPSSALSCSRPAASFRRRLSLCWAWRRANRTRCRR